MGDLQSRLRQARKFASYSQEDAGAALGVSRVMISYWEAGSRAPNDRQRSALARLYGVHPDELAEGRASQKPKGDMANVLLRADSGIASDAVPGIREFVRFLDGYSELAEIVGAPTRGMTKSPFVHREQFAQRADIRRKAQEVRKVLGLSTGPISDLDPVCEILRITVYRAHLGANLAKVPSGAFLKHPEVGFSILVNLDMTPGRRRFTVAHELAHALFHSHETNRVVSRLRNPSEIFADIFAGEFLMPREGVRRFIEEAGMPSRIDDPDDAIFVQRYFRVSWPTALVRLRQMKAISASTYFTFKESVRPVARARALGYAVDPEEWGQDAGRWNIQRFPRPYLRMLRDAVITDAMSPSTAASFAGLSLPEVMNIVSRPPNDKKEDLPLIKTEFDEFEETGVI